MARPVTRADWLLEESQQHFQKLASLALRAEGAQQMGKIAARRIMLPRGGISKLGAVRSLTKTAVLATAINVAKGGVKAVDTAADVAKGATTLAKGVKGVAKAAPPVQPRLTAKTQVSGPPRMPTPAPRVRAKTQVSGAPQGMPYTPPAAPAPRMRANTQVSGAPQGMTQPPRALTVAEGAPRGMPSPTAGVAQRPVVSAGSAAPTPVSAPPPTAAPPVGAEQQKLIDALRSGGMPADDAAAQAKSLYGMDSSASFGTGHKGRTPTLGRVNTPNPASTGMPTGAGTPRSVSAANSPLGGVKAPKPTPPKAETPRGVTPAGKRLEGYAKELEGMGSRTLSNEVGKRKDLVNLLKEHGSKPKVVQIAEQRVRMAQSSLKNAGGAPAAPASPNALTSPPRVVPAQAGPPRVAPAQAGPPRVAPAQAGPPPPTLMQASPAPAASMTPTLPVKGPPALPSGGQGPGQLAAGPPRAAPSVAQQAAAGPPPLASGGRGPGQLTQPPMAPSRAVQQQRPAMVSAEARANPVMQPAPATAPAAQTPQAAASPAASIDDRLSAMQQRNKLLESMREGDRAGMGLSAAAPAAAAPAAATEAAPGMLGRVRGLAGRIPGPIKYAPHAIAGGLGLGAAGLAVGGGMALQQSGAPYRYGGGAPMPGSY